METNENYALTKAEGCYHCKPLVQQRDELAAQVERLRGIKPEFPPHPGKGGHCEELPRYGLRWNGPDKPLTIPMLDGYWTPYHMVEALKAQVERLRCLLESAIRGEEIIVGDAIVIVIDAELADEIEESLDESPKSALAALKAQWQAEAFEIAAKLCEGESEENKPYEFAQDFSLMGEVCAETIRRYAQEAGDD